MSKKVYLLEHGYEQGDIDIVKYLGVFSSRQNAEEALEKYKTLPGFCDMPDDLHIYEIVLDFMEWSEGFITIK